MLDVTSLPNDAATLKSLLLEREGVVKHQKIEIKRYQEDILYLEEQLKLMKHRHFGASSEKWAASPLFNEIEEEAAKEPEEEEEEEVKGFKRKKAKKKSVPDHLPRETITIDLPADQKICGHGHPMHKIGIEVSEQLEIQPMKLWVKRTERIKYGCRCCEESVKTPPLPPKLISRSIATASLLAFIAVSKFCDALPLYRLEKMLQRVDVFITRGTMARWMIKVASELVPLINLLREELLASDVIHCDETRVQVLKEDGKAATSNSYMWAQAREGPDYPIILFDYDPSRGADVPVRLLDGFRGYLHLDGYDGYNRVCSIPGVIRVGCFAHVRRKFDEAIKAASSKGGGKAGEAMAFIKKLYKIEKGCKGKPPEIVFAIRQEQAKPILAELRKWLDEALDKVPPKTHTGRALKYLDSEWSCLIRYIDDGRLHIDNNYIERTIRPFALGRRNWLFSDSVEGAKASATLYSLIETAKANGLEPFKYLCYVFDNIVSAQTADDYAALLPHNVKLAKVAS